MYIFARLDKSVLLNTCLFFTYFLMLVWVNNSYLYSLHHYMGAAEKNFDFGLCVYLLCLGFACALLCGGSIRRPGDLLITLMVMVLVPHALVLNGANRFTPDSSAWSGVSLAVAMGVLLIGLLNKIRFRPLEDGQGASSGRALILLAAFNLAVLAFILMKSIGYFSFDFGGQYVRRLIAREVFTAGSVSAYLASIGTQAFFPVLFAWGLYNRRPFYILLGCLNVLILWGAFGQKYPFIVLGLIYGLMLYFRRFGQIKLSWVVTAMLLVLLAGVIEYEAFGYSYLNDYLLRRAFIVPSTLLGAVDQFVGQFGANVYADTLLATLFGHGRGESLTFQLGTDIYDNPDLNANVNFLAIAYMQLGYWGVLIESLFVAGIVILMNFLFSRYRAFMAIPVAMLFTTKILEQSLLTVLLSSGVFVMLMVLILMSVPSGSSLRPRLRHKT
jgi:hypothetical protein